MTAARKRATYADVLAAPEHKVAEIIDGELSLQPRPAPAHARAAGRLGAALDGPFDRGRDGPGGWIILPEPELHLESDVLVPDLAGWRRTLMATIPNAVGITIAPDWVCEVLSPSTARLDRAKKLPLYRRVGVVWVWLIDPLARVLEVYRRGEAHNTWTLIGTFAGDAIVRADPFGEYPIELGALWEGVAPAGE
jgi:Uma2 family endonuclease